MQRFENIKSTGLFCFVFLCFARLLDLFDPGLFMILKPNLGSQTKLRLNRTYLCAVGVKLKQKHRWKKMVVHFTRKHTNNLLLAKTLLLQCCQIIVFLSWTYIFLARKGKDRERKKYIMAMFFFSFFNHIEFIAEAYCKVLPHRSETHCLVVKNMLGPQTSPESLGWIIMQTVLPAFVLDNIYKYVFVYQTILLTLTLLCPVFLEFWRLSITAHNCDAYMDKI